MTAIVTVIFILTLPIYLLYTLYLYPDFPTYLQIPLFLSRKQKNAEILGEASNI